MYAGEAATEEELAKDVVHLKNAFSEKATDAFCFELIRLALKQGITRQRFTDAIDNYITTHKYNTITIADILNYDVRVKLYTGSEVFKICKTLGDEKDMREYPKYGVIDGVMYRVCASEIEALPFMIREKIKRKINEQNSK